MQNKKSHLKIVLKAGRQKNLSLDSIILLKNLVESETGPGSGFEII
jgi:hypothetical protein